MRPARELAATAVLGGLVSLLVAGILLRGALIGSLALFGSDYMTLNYPLYDWVQRAWRETGEVALWLPHLFGGMPFVGSMNSGMLYPPELAACLAGVPAHRFYAWSAWAHEGIAGAGAAWMLAREGLPRGAAVWGGAVYALGGLVLTQLGVADTFTHRAAAWLPWLVGGLRGCRRGDFALSSVVLGLLWLTCAVQMIVFGALFIVVLAALERPRPVSRVLAVFGGVAAAGSLMGAALLLPAFDYYRFSDRPEATEAFTNLWAFHPARLIGFLVPGVWGRTAVNAVYFGPYLSDNTSVYPGLLPLAFAAWGVTVAWRRRLPWLGAGAVAVLLAFGGQTPAGRLLQQMPVLGGFRGWGRWLLFANLGFALFAAEGWAALAERKRSWAAPAVLGMVVAGALAAWLLRGEVTKSLLDTAWASERIASGDVARPAAERTVRAALARAAWVAPVSLAVALAAPAVPASLAGVLAGAWAVSDLAVVARPFLELGPARRLSVYDPLGEYLDAQKGLFRVVSEEAATHKNLRIGRDVHFVWGYHGVPPRALYRFGGALHRAGYPRGLLAVLNVRYYVMKEPAITGDLRLIGRMRCPDGTTMYLHEFRDALRRVFFPAEGRVVPDEDAALEAMLEPGWDWRTAMLSGRHARASRFAPASATPLVLRPNERETVVSARGPALAVLSAVWYPGWLAFVDDVRVPIVRADSLLMAVEVPAGEHRLLFRRDPRPFRIGLLLTCLAAAALAAVVVAGFRRRTGPEPTA